MPRFPSVLACLLAVAVAIGGCGGGGGADRPALGPAEMDERMRELRGAPPPLAALHEQANELLDGGRPAFEARLRELRGHPVVVNKWGSWCGPCRDELPHFQRQALKHGKRVAFLGVDAAEYGGYAAAERLLEQLPVTYPSYKDPDLKVSAAFNAVAATPATAFYDSQGELAYLKQGAYLDEESFAEDIARYAR